MPTTKIDVDISLVIKNLISPTSRIPNHGLKKGKNAIELRIVAISKLMLVKSKI